ncbi:MAG TPA: transglycosylase SLT domain-containing protein [Thermoanaerobaculaceae bacterium]|nr:transglycosylase SLT domain-containing protein [Thermoanaerobaculaceae bacterium]
MIGGPPPAPALADAVRGGRWAEVRAAADSLPRPLAPEVALAAARAARFTGDAARALDLARGAIARGGELAPALRLEAAAAAASLGRDPFPFLAPLLARSAPPAPRREAERCLRAAWETLPIETVRRVRRGTVPRELWREHSALLAERAGDREAALRVLEERVGDRAALRAARWLAGAPGVSPAGTLAVAEALLAGGAWHDADALLATQSRPLDAQLRFRWAFLRGRAAYRLGDLDRAAKAYDEALAAASSDADRFAAAVQRARTAEVAGDVAAAMPLWDAARAAAPREVEGWDGGARTRAVAGRASDAAALLQSCPVPVARVAGPRLAAILLARGELAAANAALARLPDRLPVVRVLSIASQVASGDVEGARTRTADVLADPRSGGWRETVLGLLPAANQPPEGTAAPMREPTQLARLAATRGAPAARASLAAALLADPAWAPLFQREPAEPAAWVGAAQRLVAVGMDSDAASVFPGSFPRRTPEETAWSAARLAAWGNRPAALTAGEQLWTDVGAFPAVLLPAALLRRILPEQLIAGCHAAARAEGASAGWLVGIIRQESRFDSGAFSSAGAVGISQFVPDVASQMGVSREELRDPDIALRLAAREVCRLRARYGARLPIVAAAYNAGENVVTSWLTEMGDNPADAVFAAAIPYRETAGYVLAVCEGAELAGGSEPRDSAAADVVHRGPAAAPSGAARPAGR